MLDATSCSRGHALCQQVLSSAPGVREQMLAAHVRQDWSLPPQAWTSWWHALALRCKLLETS